MKKFSSQASQKSDLDCIYRSLGRHLNVGVYIFFHTPRYLGTIYIIFRLVPLFVIYIYFHIYFFHFFFFLLLLFFLLFSSTCVLWVYVFCPFSCFFLLFLFSVLSCSLFPSFPFFPFFSFFLSLSLLLSWISSYTV